MQLEDCYPGCNCNRSHLAQGGYLRLLQYVASAPLRLAPEEAPFETAREEETPLSILTLDKSIALKNMVNGTIVMHGSGVGIRVGTVASDLMFDEMPSSPHLQKELGILFPAGAPKKMPTVLSGGGRTIRRGTRGEL